MKSLLKNPPEGYEFVVNEQEKTKKVMDSVRKSKILTSLYTHVVKKFCNGLTLTNKISHKKAPDDVDLIFSTGQLIDEKKPWVIKLLDSPFALGGNDYKIFLKNKDTIEEKLLSPYCKKIIVHTNIAKAKMAHFFSEKVIDKIEVMTPAIPLTITKKERHGTDFNMLFIGSINNPDDFIMKGGIDAIKAYRALKKKYDNVHLTIKCKIPDTIKKEYDLSGITVIEDIISLEAVQALYKNADIMLMQGYGGYMIMAYMEAFSYGTPIIALDTFGVSDFIENEKTGFRIKPEPNEEMESPAYPSNSRSVKFLKSLEESGDRVTNESVKKIELLINNPELLKRMSEECQKRAAREFSFDKKRKTLKRIFDEATA